MKNKLIAIVAVGLIILASTVAQAADWQNSITRIDLMGRIQVYSFKNFEAYYIASADGHWDLRSIEETELFRPIGTDIELYAKTPPTPVTNGQPPIIMWPVSNLYTLSLFYKCLREAAGGFYDLRTYYKGIDVSNGLEGMYMLGQNSPRIICEGHSYPGQSLLLPAPSTIGKNFDQITGWSKTVQRCPEISFQVDSRGFFPTLGNNSRLTLVIMGFQTDGSRSMPIAEKSLSWNTRQVVNFDFARYQDSWYWLVMPIEEPGTETEMPEIPYAPE